MEVDWKNSNAHCWQKRALANAFSGDWQEQKWTKYISRNKFNLIGDDILLRIPFNVFIFSLKKYCNSNE
jgi:hypothetical protein